MNPHLQSIFNFIEQSDSLSAEEKSNILKSLKDANKELEITAFKLDRTEKVKKTTAILLEETIEELEQKRKAVEAQNHELEIEAALERVRAVAMGMKQQADMLDICKTISQQLALLNVKEIRNVQTAIFYEEKGTYMNYEYYAKHDKTFITETSYTNHEIHQSFASQMLKGNGEFYITHIKGDEVKNWMAYQKTTNVFIDDYINTASSLNYYWYSLGPVALGISTYEPLKEVETILFTRFLKVFELSYTRYLDIEKAEAQAKESQIQLALERVRARAMAMQRSDELSEAAGLLFQQVQSLGAPSWTAGYCIFDEDKRAINLWMSRPWGDIQPSFRVPLDENPSFIRYLEAYNKGLELYVEEISGKALEENYQYLLTLPIVGEQLKSIIAEGHSLPTYEVDHCAYFPKGFLLFITYQQVPELHSVFKRFAAVFDQTYTRFLDLKQAEAQAREAQIQLALERVRARTMAMQKSDELADASFVLDSQVRALGIKTRGCAFNIYGDNESTEWFSSEAGTIPVYKTPRENVFLRYYEHGLKGEPVYVESFEGEACAAHYEYLELLPIMGDAIKKLKETGGIPTTQTDQVAYFKYGYLLFATLRPVPEAHDIFIRFAQVFEQTYTRFLDLQKAEAQAREAQIEAALERVRSRSLAMHKSEELQQVVHTVFEKLRDLNVDFYTVIIIIFQEASKDITWWMENKESQQYPRILIRCADIPYFRDLFEAKESGKEMFSKCYFSEEKNVLYKYLFDDTDLRQAPEKQKKFLLESEFATMSVAFAKNTAIHITSYSERSFSEEANEILKRFAKVFDQAYTRFLDLQKAEAQAREAQIEAALERVRGKVMAMRSSEDMNETIKVFYHQLESLRLTPRRCGVGLLNKENRTAELSTINTTTDGQSIELIGKLDMTMHPVLEGVYNGWLKQEEYHPVLLGNEIKEYYKILRPQIQFPDYPDDAVQYGYFFFFDEGGVYAWTEKQMEEAELQIYRRFTSVLNLTYKRYKDLKQAEANAKEAVKQAALDRIRADIASMRSVSDLDRITPLIWNELTVLGIPFIRCGVFLMDDAQQLIHTFLSAPDGRAIAAFHMPYDTPGNLGKVLSHWQRKKNYTDHWSGDEFISLADTLLKQGSIANKEEYLGSLPQGGFYLHFLPFLQGMLYVGNTNKLSEEGIKLLQSVADAFSTAYARYEDFNKLEAAKKQVDVTLNELQATQKQLIQSEKMASLGELTAGIAHEIQNPLNFVNNFSEVNRELINELVEEVDKGNTEEVKAIAKDIRDNEEKINHHGKRADSIVKGMLQHSKTSTGVKEPTDINALCDEYLRLAYHGLRAKDKSFNADFKTDFDETIDKINIIPQDIGRVLLNLFNNAFYAVNQKQKESRHLLKGSEPYVPTVTVVTKKAGDKIEIKVKDNGNGIPQKIVDKIFQPFFTTKPTGQGTGLGLSLAYDIIKAHSGEIKVETKENEGTGFIIQLSVV
ncbi:MAG TPA: ATP-binding protein [Parafilimonas sp.]|nr:ATP-binding protein [Parafilimonas sp.]